MFFFFSFSQIDYNYISLCHVKHNYYNHWLFSFLFALFRIAHSTISMSMHESWFNNRLPSYPNSFTTITHTHTHKSQFHSLRMVWTTSGSIIQYFSFNFFPLFSLPFFPLLFFVFWFCLTLPSNSLQKKTPKISALNDFNKCGEYNFIQ